MKKTSAQALKNILPLSLKELGIEEQLLAARVIRHWQQTPWGAYTERIFVKDKVLNIKITSSFLRNDLFLQKELILSTLNKFLKTEFLKDLKFL